MILTLLSSTVPFSTLTSRHLHMVFICSWFDIREPVILMRIFYIDRSFMLTRKILNQGFIETRLRSTLKKFFGRYHQHSLIVSQWPHVGPDIVVVSTIYPRYDIGDLVTGAACGAENAYPSGAPDFTSGFYRDSCCPVSLFHVIVMSFGFWVLIVRFVWLLTMFFTLIPCNKIGIYVNYGKTICLVRN